MIDPLLEGLPDPADGLTPGTLPDSGSDPLLSGLPDRAPPIRPALLRAERTQPDKYVEAERAGAELGDAAPRDGERQPVPDACMDAGLAGDGHGHRARISRTDFRSLFHDEADRERTGVGCGLLGG